MEFMQVISDGKIGNLKNEKGSNPFAAKTDQRGKASPPRLRRASIFRHATSEENNPASVNIVRRWRWRASIRQNNSDRFRENKLRQQ